MRRHKIVKVDIRDVVVDPAGQSEMISAACRRGAGATATGLCQVGDEVFVSLEMFDEDDGAESSVEYAFSPFRSENADEVVAEMKTRFFSGFSLVGGFYVGRAPWGLFRRSPDAAEVE